MLHGCHMSIVAMQVPYASWMSYEYSGLPRFLMLHGCHMSIVAMQVPYASWMLYEYSGLQGSLCFMDVIWV